MKLKKIASLMLAGVMAVSMLAGCNGKTETKPEGEGEGEGTTASGYSAMLGEKAADDLYKEDRDKIFTFADNADDQKILEKVVLRDVTDASVATIAQLYYVTNRQSDTGFTKLIDDDFREEKDTVWGVVGGLTNVNDSQNTTYFTEVYVANGSVPMDAVMDEIYEHLKADFIGAKKTNSTGSTALNYEYAVSVSVVNVPVTANTLVNGSANFIAVTVTRTAEVA